ncbi:MAG: deoxyribonuclease IV [Phycisphaerales bacterium]|nr:deoxyribonuclease IV [Phycisphaerales bacterium]
MHHAIEAALALNLDTVQVFVKNQRQWKATPFRSDDLQRWHALRATPGFCPPTAHATYLINLASGDDALRERSRIAFAEELERCDTLEIPYLVIHPGAALDAPAEEAIERVASSLNQIFAERPALRTMPLLEATAGQGSTLGRTMEQLAAIIEGVRESRRVGVCIDTCHVFAAGYDIRDQREYEKMIATADRLFGVERIRCWHLNDSRGALGSRVDRHEHIGKGQIGPAGFANVLRDKRFVNTPMILETPKETAPDGRDWDTVNVEVLRGLE